jgi:hypothetical protein
MERESASVLTCVLGMSGVLARGFHATAVMLKPCAKALAKMVFVLSG